MKKRINSLITKIFFLSLFISFFQVNLAFAQEKDLIEKKESEHTYLIKLPHTPETCLQTLDDISRDKPEALSKIDWGCMSGDHTGYMTVKSRDEESALKMLPASLQKEAKIEKVNRFSKEQIRSFHKKLD